MDNVEMLSTLETQSTTPKTKSKKRKWREIEAIQDNYRLKRELSDLDHNFEYELAQLTQ